MYGESAATWYLAPGSKSLSLRTTGGETPWTLHLNRNRVELALRRERVFNLELFYQGLDSNLKSHQASL